MNRRGSRERAPAERKKKRMKLAKWCGAGLFALLLILSLAACSNGRTEPAAEEKTAADTKAEVPDTGMAAPEEKDETEDEVLPVLKMTIDGREIPVIWEENESTAALAELAAKGPVTVQMSMYGGFEQVGSLGTALPRNDLQTTTGAGDIVLYAGDRIVVFFGSNSWAYTSLGKIDGMNGEELKRLLGNADVELVLFTEAES